MSGSVAHVVGVVTWFHPGQSARRNLERAVQECDAVIVVDNTPGAAPMPAPDARGVTYVRPGSNLGLAGALNAAVELLPAACDAVLLLDQDSTVPDGLVQRLARHLERPAVGIVGPLPWDAREDRALDPRTPLRRPVAEVDALITSGMLVRREVLRTTGPFREEFFVDAVDQDFCLRARRAGWLVLQDRTVRLPHDLGSTTWHHVLRWRVRATHHPDWRLRAGARNSTVLVRENLLRRPRWAVVNTLQLGYWLVTVLAFEPPRFRRGHLFLRGVGEGLLGRPVEGPPAASVPGPG